MREKFQKTQNIIKTIQQYVTVGSWELDSKTGKITCSDVLSHLVGLDIPRSSFFKNRETFFIHPDDRSLVREDLELAAQKHGYCSTTFTAILPDKSEHLLQFEGEVVPCRTTSHFSLTGIINNLTRNIILEAFNMANRSRLFEITNLNPSPVFIINNQFEIQFVNQAFEKITGFSSNEILGSSRPYPWWPRELADKYSEDLEIELITRTGKKYRQQFKIKSGRSIWVEAELNSLYGSVVSTSDTTIDQEGMNYHLIYLKDISQQVRYYQNMQSYRAERILVQEEERKRLATEVHDDILQYLAFLSLEMESLGKENHKSEKKFPELLEEMRAAIQSMAGRLRSLSHELHPSVIDQGLIPALETIAQETGKANEISVQFNAIGTNPNLTPETALGIYRIAQEAIRNTIKHAGASELHIVLRNNSKRTSLTIHDDGIGFEIPEESDSFASQRKLGIIGMHERAQLAKGNLTIKSRRGKGTTVKLIVDHNG